MRLALVCLFLPIIQGAKRNSREDDTNLPGVDSIGMAPRLIRVPFGHIFKDGIEDPLSDQKQPVDMLELHLKTPWTPEEAKEMVKGIPPERIYKVDKKRYSLYKDEDDADMPKSEAPPRRDSEPQWFDFSAIHSERLKNPGRQIPTPYRKHNSAKESVGSLDSDWNRQNKVVLPEEPKMKIKWTNCTEFSKGSSSFHPRDIVDIAWTPFYIWAPREFSAVVYRFTYPTKKIVKEYKQLYSHLIKEKLDWEQPKLVLNESIEMLLIADPKDRRGLFHGVIRRPIPKNPKSVNLLHFTVPKIRVKIVDPYLALMHCNEYFATIMAAPGNEPATDQERIDEASTLNFTGTGYPVKRDLEEERAAEREMEKIRKESEPVKYIKAINLENLHVDMD